MNQSAEQSTSKDEVRHSRQVEMNAAVGQVMSSVDNLLNRSNRPNNGIRPNFFRSDQPTSAGNKLNNMTAYYEPESDSQPAVVEPAVDTANLEAQARQLLEAAYTQRNS